MKMVFFPFFLMRLALASLPSVIRLAKPSLPPLSPVVLSICLLGLVLTGQPPVLSPPPSFQSAVLGTQTTNTQELSHWLALYSIQPTHRDVLTNLALIYQAEGMTEETQKFYRLAKAVDPNNPLTDQLIRLR